jgi:hypothetical protein
MVAERIDATHILVRDLRSFGVDTIAGLEGPFETISRGHVVVVHGGTRRLARGHFVGFDDATHVLWVAWAFDPYNEEEADRVAYRAACEAFDDMRIVREARRKAGAA